VEQSPAELVVDALKSLPDEDRDRALAWLIDRGAHWPPPEEPARFPRLEPGLVQGTLERYASLRGEHQGVLVRLPVEQHTRLREWCDQHGFAMATVIRGLVDRFLEQQTAT
jgi:hypothetical protein